MRADHVEPQALKTLLDGTARRIAEVAACARSVQIGQDLGSARTSFRGPHAL